MVARDNALLQQILPGARSFKEALRESITPEGTLLPDPRQSIRKKDDATIREAQLVRSVQRFDLPEGRTAEWAGREYMRWLDGFARPLLQVSVEESDGESKAAFFVRPLTRAVLELTFSPDRSTPDRALFYVTGGILADRDTGRRARLEFRSVLNGDCLLAAIHDFAPRLPWGLYRFTQAVAHLFVMHRFGRYLARLDQPAARRSEPTTPVHEA
jgi:hypothetical protein